MQEDRVSAKMEDAAIWTLGDRSDLQIPENNPKYLTTRSQGTSGPVGCKWRALCGHGAKQVNVEA